ncbi:unnamed protein product, partial [Iphiclides podalirius]
MARSKRHTKRASCYNTKVMEFKEFFDLSALANQVINNRNKDENGDRINWLKIKSFRFRKDRPGKIEYKYMHSEEYKTISVHCIGRPRTLPTRLPQLYKKRLPISVQKKKDLLKLCRQGAIPEDFPWYKQLPTSSTAEDYAENHSEEEGDQQDD